jgi:hypothetical protein
MGEARSDAGGHTDPGARGEVRRSRREVMRSAGVGAAALTAGAIARPSTGGASTLRRGTASDLSTALGFIVRIDQDGGDFSGYGFLTQAAGIPDEVLFGNGVDRSEATAPLTIVGTGTLERRSVRGSVFVLDAVGTLQIHLLEAPGANFADPSSFATGTVVARYSAELHDVLTVIAPNTGIPVLSGDLTQTAATRFTLDAKRYQIGSKGNRLVLEGTGLGTRSDAEIPRSHIDIDARVTTA